MRHAEKRLSNTHTTTKAQFVNIMRILHLKRLPRKLQLECYHISNGIVNFVTPLSS